MSTKKLTYEFIKSEIEKEDYILLSKEYTNSKTNFIYICPKGHKRTVNWNNWQQGARCYACGRILTGKKQTHSIKFITKEFIKKNLELISEIETDNKRKFKYRCLICGYEGIKIYSDLRNGKGCPNCYLKSKKGKSNPNYNFNLTQEERESNRNTPEYREWKYKIKERDDFTCQICGIIKVVI